MIRHRVRPENLDGRPPVVCACIQSPQPHHMSVAVKRKRENISQIQQSHEHRGQSDFICRKAATKIAELPCMPEAVWGAEVGVSLSSSNLPAAGRRVWHHSKSAALSEVRRPFYRTRHFACHIKELRSLLSGPTDTLLNALRHFRADPKDRPQVPLRPRIPPHG